MLQDPLQDVFLERMLSYVNVSPVCSAVQQGLPDLYHQCCHFPSANRGVGNTSKVVQDSWLPQSECSELNHISPPATYAEVELGMG